MKKVLFLSIFLLAVSGTFAQKNNSSSDTRDKNKKENSETIVQSDTVQSNKEEQDLNSKKADKQPQDVRYQEGASGVKRSISYKFSNIVTDEDPGNGIFRYNSNSPSDITYILVDINDLSGEDQTKWYSTWDDTTGATARGRINLVEYEGQNIDIFDVSGVFIKEAGYWKIPVKYISGVLPADGATYYYVFERIENKDKTAKSEKEESESKEKQENIVKEVVKADTAKQENKVVEVIAAVTTAAIINEPKEGSQPVQVEVVEEKKTEEVTQETKPTETSQVTQPAVEVKEEQVIPADTIKEAVKNDEVKEAAAAVAVVTEPKAENQPVQEVEEKKAEEVTQETKPTETSQVTQSAEEVKVEPVVPAYTVVEEVKNDVAKEAAAAVAVVSVVTEPKAESQSVQVVEEKKTEEVKEEKILQPEPVKQEVNEEKVAEVAAVVAVTAMVTEPKVENQPVQVIQEIKAEPEKQNVQEQKAPETNQASQPVQEIKETPVQQTETVKQQEPVKEEVKEEKLAEVATAVAVTTVVAEPKTKSQPVQVIQEAKAEEKRAAEVAVTTRTAQPNEMKQPVQSKQETQTTNQTQTTQSTSQKSPATQTQTTQTRQNTQVNQPTQGVNQTKQTTRTTPEPQISQGSTTSNGYSMSKRSDGTRIWHGIIEAGYGFKAGEYGLNNYRIHFINSFSLGQYFMIGLGIGYRSYVDKPDKHPDWHMVSSKNQIPVFLDLRAVLSRKKLSPFLALGLGSSTEKSSSDTTSYGSFVNPSAGIWYRISRNTAIFADIAYEMQQLEFAKFSDNIPYKKNSGSISLNIGIQF